MTSADLDVELGVPANGRPAEPVARGQPRNASAASHADGADPPPPLIDVGRFVRQSPPWLVSGVLHMVALIVLGLWAVASDYEGPFQLEARYAEELGEVDLDTIDDFSPLDTVEIEQTELVSQEVPIVDDPLSLPDMVPVEPNASLLATNTPSIVVGVALSGRDTWYA